jgi:hypothetical protein
MFHRDLVESAEKGLAVAVIAENELSTVASDRHVIDPAGDLHTWTSRHAQ